HDSPHALQTGALVQCVMRRYRVLIDSDHLPARTLGILSAFLFLQRQTGSVLSCLLARGYPDVKNRPFHVSPLSLVERYRNTPPRYQTAERLSIIYYGRSRLDDTPPRKARCESLPPLYAVSSALVFWDDGLSTMN